jgi:prevent-host-death family protein
MVYNFADLWTTLSYTMQISMKQAKAQLTELVKRAEAGEDVVLTRHGRPTVKLVPVERLYDPEARGRAIDAVLEAARGRATPGPDAAHAADFLYDDDGLPA